MSIDYTSDRLDAEIRYLARQAPQSAIAHTLTSHMGLPLDGDPLANGRSTMLYVHRLVLLGLDTPENLLALFGGDVDAPQSSVRRDLLTARMNMQGLVAKNGQDACQVPGFMNVGIPSGEKINVRKMSREEQEETMKKVMQSSYA